MKLLSVFALIILIPGLALKIQRIEYETAGSYQRLESSNSDLRKLQIENRSKKAELVRIAKIELEKEEQKKGIIADISARLEGHPYQKYAAFFYDQQQRTGIPARLVVAIGWVEQGKKPFLNNAWGLTNGTTSGCQFTGNGYCAFGTPEIAIAGMFDFMQRKGWTESNIRSWGCSYSAGCQDWIGKVMARI